ncbi:PcfB family protein [Thomasclavelia spiroformis]|uniref:PcfB family protein n=1 Tax=Thomasclavelia spiroformis TaxID=29348 RepID=UPI00255BD38A|nr:PcfB family protein [Thomasclavelia spiroformis]
MNAGGETADQAVRMSLQGIQVAAEIALKAGGMASKSLAVTLYAILTDKKKVKGKARLESMLKSGKELKVFAIRHEDLKTFCAEAKRYGVLYSVLKEKNNTTGICDIMVRAEDASKISRIVDKYELATVDTNAIRKAYEAKNQNSVKDVSPMSDEQHDALVNELLNSMKKEDRDNSRNPKTARTAKKDENQFEHTSKKVEEGVDFIKKDRPSVRKELKEIQENKARKNNYQKNKFKQKNVFHKSNYSKRKLKRKVR